MVHIGFCESVGLASGESIMLEFFPNAEGVYVDDPPEAMRRCVLAFVGVDVVAGAFERGCVVSERKFDGRFERGSIEEALSGPAGEEGMSALAGVSFSPRYERAEVETRGGELVLNSEKEAVEADGVQSSFFLWS